MAYRPMLGPFQAETHAFTPPRRRALARRYPKSPGNLAAICPAGHALTVAQVGGACPLCVAQGLPTA